MRNTLIIQLNKQITIIQKHIQINSNIFFISPISVFELEIKKSQNIEKMNSQPNLFRIREQPSKESLESRNGVQPKEVNSHLVRMSRNNCRRILDLAKKLRNTTQRFQQKIKENMPQEMVCKLQLFRLIYQGTFSKVYKVRSIPDGKHYALKKIQVDGQHDNREEHICKILKNNFVVVIKDTYHSKKDGKDELNILMQLYQSSLRDMIEKKTSMDPIELKMIAYQMVRAVHYLHSKGICHRDLKPSNFLADQKGRLYLNDFASAKLMKKQQTSICQIGQRGYRAPQLLLGCQRYDQSIDIWSLGCIIIQLLTGKQIFNGSSNMDCLLNIARYFGTKDLLKIQGQPQLIRIIPSLKGIGLKSLIGNTSQNLLDLVSKMLQVDSRRRLATIDILVHPFFDDLRDEQIYFEISKERGNISNFFNFSKSQLKNYEQYYTKLIPIWKREKPEKYSSY